MEFDGFYQTFLIKKYLTEMLEQLSSRGPDAEGKYLNDKINLGHKRLQSLI